MTDVTEQHVLAALAAVSDPERGGNVVELGMISGNSIRWFRRDHDMEKLCAGAPYRSLVDFPDFAPHSPRVVVTVQMALKGAIQARGLRC